MKIIKYIEHLVTNYEKFFKELDRLYQESNIMNFSREKETVVEFTIDNTSNNLYLHTTKKVPKKDDLYYYELLRYHTSNKEELKHYYYPAEQSSLSNSISFKKMEFTAKNYDALLEAIDLCESECPKLRDLKKGIRFRCPYGDFYATITIDFVLTPYKREENYIFINVNFGNYKSTPIFYDLNKHYFYSTEHITWEELEQFDIPDDILPDAIKDTYRSNNVRTLHFTDDELYILPHSCKDEREIEFARMQHNYSKIQELEKKQRQENEEKLLRYFK